MFIVNQQNAHLQHIKLEKVLYKFNEKVLQKPSQQELAFANQLYFFKLRIKKNIYKERKTEEKLIHFEKKND